MVGVKNKYQKTIEIEKSLEELDRLADTAGAEIITQVLYKVEKYNPAYFIGKGQAEKTAKICQENNLQTVIFDDDLSPAQQRNLEEIIGTKIIDRTKLILDIFAKRAHTAEGKLQVELAQMDYLLPRLSGKGVALSQQVGGIGTRGPGERKLEYDRRKIRDRVATLRREIDKLRQYRARQRQTRHEVPIPVIALVGYTNTGKSTLLNTLTQAHIFVEDKLFATLDPTTRRVILPNKQKVLFTDTVGFIRKLPHQLVAAFRATLEEVTQADILLHIVDASHPEYEQQMTTVYKVLQELNIADKPTVTVFNKIDLLSNKWRIKRLLVNHPDSVAISALKHINLHDLFVKLTSVLDQPLKEKTFFIPYEKYNLASNLFASGNISKQEFKPQGILIKAKIDQKTGNFLKKYIKT